LTRQRTTQFQYKSATARHAEGRLGQVSSLHLNESKELCFVNTQRGTEKKKVQPFALSRGKYLWQNELSFDHVI